MSDLIPNLPPPIIVTVEYETQQLEQVIRGVGRYNILLIESGEPPLAPDHALIKLQSVLIKQLDPLIHEGVANGWRVGDLLKLKAEIQDLIDLVDDDPVL